MSNELLSSLVDQLASLKPDKIDKPVKNKKVFESVRELVAQKREPLIEEKEEDALDFGALAVPSNFWEQTAEYYIPLVDEVGGAGVLLKMVELDPNGEHSEYIREFAQAFNTYMFLCPKCQYLSLANIVNCPICDIGSRK